MCACDAYTDEGGGALVMAVGAAGAAGTRCGWAWKAFRGGEGALGIARLYIWVMRLERVYRGGCRHSRIMINVAVNFNMASGVEDMSSFSFRVVGIEVVTRHYSKIQHECRTHLG